MTYSPSFLKSQVCHHSRIGKGIVADLCRYTASTTYSTFPNHSAKEETETVPLEDMVDEFFTFYAAGKFNTQLY